VIVLDITVLVYAVGTDHPFREPCRQLVQAIADEQVRGSTTVEVLQEFVHVRARRRPRDEAVELGAAFADLLSPLLPVSESELRAGLRLFERVERLGAFDAVLAAAALTAQAQALVSADGAFAEVPRLSHVVPDESGVARLLA
jgi:uncharacterized protein